MISYILAILTGLAVFTADRYTKILIASSESLKMGKSYDFIKGFIDITYTTNDGGAWGMLGGYTWILLSITVIIMIVCIALLLKFGTKNKLMFWAISLVFFGGIGNMYDRIFNGGNVVDFLHFTFMPKFPVFNIADCAIVIGAGLLILYFINGMIKDSKVKNKSVEEITSDMGKNEKI